MRAPRGREVNHPITTAASVRSSSPSRASAMSSACRHAPASRAASTRAAPRAGTCASAVRSEVGCGPMRRYLFVAFVGLSLATNLVEARPFRWASQGDVQTIDPHSQNELLTNSVNGQMYETLVNRGKKLEIVPVLATAWQQVDPRPWRF